MRLLVILAACLGLGSGSLTFQQKYSIWAADLPAGFIIQANVEDGRTCYCKVPAPTTNDSAIDGDNTTTTTTPTTTSTTTTTPTTTSTTTTSTTTTTPTTTSTTTTTPTTTSTTTTTPTTTSTTTTSTTTTTPKTTSTTTTTPTTTSTTTTTPTTTSTTTTTTTTTTPTTTSTTTTTPTTTSTTTTTPTTTSTTTTTPTTTSTTTTSTTTTTPTTTSTTTTTAPDCDLTIDVSYGGYAYWQSPNYPNDYPEDITCTLTVTGIYRMIFIKQEGPGEVVRTGYSCATSPDRIEVYKDGIKSYLCGRFQGIAYGSMAYFSTKTICLKFISSSADGKAAMGFRFKIFGAIFGRK